MDCIGRITEISKCGDISEDFVLYDATLRNLQTLSESTTHLPESLKVQYSSINWYGINGFRNILAHDYLGRIDSQTVVRIIDEYLPELEKIMIKILHDKKDV